ncbi:MAG: hypothetical protein ACK5YR_20935 [Pirellula sp.]
MMNSWVRKEAKDILRWTPIGFVLLSLAVWNFTREVSQRSLPSNAGVFGETSFRLFAITFAISTIFGTLLGIASFWKDSGGDARAFLVHRGVSLTRIYTSRTVIGFLAFALSMWIPILYGGIYFYVIGNAIIPVTANSVVPSIIIVSYSFAFFLAGSLIATRSSHWLGSRLLPLFAAFAVICTVLPLLFGEFEWFLITGTMGIIGMIVLWEAGRTAFVRGISQSEPAQHYHTPRAERLILVSSITIATAISAWLVFDTQPFKPDWERSHALNTQFDSDGTPWIVELYTHHSRLYGYRQGRVLAPLADDLPPTEIPSVSSLQSGLEMTNTFESSNRTGLWDMMYISNFGGYFWYGHRGLVYVYGPMDEVRGLNGQLIAVIGPNAIGDLNSLPKDRFQAYPVLLKSEVEAIGKSVDRNSFLVLAMDGAYRVDLRSRLIEKKLDLSIDWYEERPKVINEDRNYTVYSQVRIISDNRVAVYESEVIDDELSFRQQAIAKFDIPADIDVSKFQGGLAFLKDDRNWTFIPTVPANNPYRYFESGSPVIQVKDGAIKYSQVRATKDLDTVLTSIADEETPKSMLFIPPVLQGASWIPHLIYGKSVVWNSNWMLGLLQAVLSGVLCLTAARYRCLSGSRSLLWFVLGALLGLGTWGALLAIYPRVYRVRCANCGRMRRIENDNCEKCGAAWESLKPLEIEILSNHTPSPQSQPAA